MRIRRLTQALWVLAVVAAIATPAVAQELKDGEVTVRIETALGNIDLAVDTRRAPITAANFLKYVDGKFYDGGRFHRATRPDNYTPSPPDKPAMEMTITRASRIAQ